MTMSVCAMVVPSSSPRAPLSNHVLNSILFDVNSQFPWDLATTDLIHSLIKF